MITYLEVIDKETLKAFEIIEPNECWFELSYYDVGQFEVYCSATKKNLAALQKGNYIAIPNRRFIWVITSIEYTTTEKRTRMISAKGYEAKWLLNKRIIEKPLELATDLARAVYNIVYNNLGAGAREKRIIEHLDVELSDTTTTIDKTQATRGNLLTFVNELIKSYEFGSQIIYNGDYMVYQLLKGINKTSTIKFSQSLDNLLESSYLSDDGELGTNILVVSTVDDVDYTASNETSSSASGVDRAEVYLESKLATKYTDVNGEEQELNLSDDEDLQTYLNWLYSEGAKELAANHIIKTEVNGTIDLVNSQYEFDIDFFIGDLVRIQDEYFNFYVDKRILKYTIAQSSEGYSEHCEYGE